MEAILGKVSKLKIYLIANAIKCIPSFIGLCSILLTILFISITSITFKNLIKTLQFVYFILIYLASLLVFFLISLRF